MSKKDNVNGYTKNYINCLITIYLTPSTKPYFIRDYKNLDNAYFI